MWTGFDDDRGTEGAAGEAEDPLVTLVARGSRSKALAGGAAAAAVLVLVAVWFLGRADAADHRLLVRNADGSVSLLDTQTGTSVYDVPDAVPTPDRSSLFTTRIDGDRTILESRNARSGVVTGETTLEGHLHVRTVSPAGTAVALMPTAPGENLYEPRPRTTTELVVASLDDTPALTYTLEGNFEPEMFSLDESVLFLLEFVPPEAPAAYHVRKLDLATGDVTDTGAPDLDVDSAMRGRARAQAMTPDGRLHFTAYTLPATAPIADPEAAGHSEHWSFVHVISLDEKWSACIFLPEPFGTDAAGRVGMTVSPDGSNLLVADPAAHRVARIDTASLEIREVHHVDLLVDQGHKAVLAEAGDGTVYVSAGHVILELAPGTLEARHAYSHEGKVTSLAVAGDELRIGGGGQVVLFDRSSRTETGVIGGSGRGTVDLLGPPGGSVLEFPLECAC